MPHPEGDHLADLTTAPIFDDAVYLSEALNLPAPQNEDDLDAELALRARESGVEDPYRYLCPDPHDISTAMSTLTVDSEHRSSMSIHSRETQYTGFTSHPSRTSRDHTQIAQVDRSPALRTPPPPPSFAPAALSMEGYMYDTVMEHFRPGPQHRHSSSNVSAATKSVASNSSLSKSAPRKFKRGSGFLSMFRRDSSSCSSRSHHGHHGKPLSPKLECGHSLSKFALRLHIQEALESKDHVTPACCGKPIPRSVLELVLTKEETDIVTSSALQSPDLGSLRDSGYSENGMSSIDLPRALDVQSLPTSFVTAPATPSPTTPPVDEETLKNIVTNEAFQALKSQQEEQYQRVSTFEANQRKALSSYHQRTMVRLAAQHESDMDIKTKQHVVELERLEEFQLVAEHDLRRAQAQEVQNVETALKYMGAYCAGTNPIHPELAHVVTEEDQKALARQRLTQQKLPGKHESAINVLRAKQERDTKLKLEKQQAELDQIDSDYEKEKRTEENQYAKDTNRLDAMIEGRRRRLRNRWDLQFEIWRREWEHQNETTLNGQLPQVDWPEKKIDDNMPINSSSTLAVFLLTVN